MLPGETVTIEYLEIDELEAKCWVQDYSVIAYLDNENQKLLLSDIGKKDLVKIFSVDKDTGRIELKKLF